MKLFNTLTQSLEPLTPVDNTVRVYVCGITPYDTTHLGHAFLYVSFDALIRYLTWLGYNVNYVQNVTDIDDDVLRKSRELGLAWDELGRREIARFLLDMDTLNVRRPDVYAKATEEIPTIVEIVKNLVAQGYAYVNEGCVFFSIKSDPEFGEMARAIGLRDYHAMLQIANERGNFPNDTRKRDPLDFVLWQAQAPGEPAWESPWGPGRPGWHIECSAMALRYLGSQIDIHGGGGDLAFPHHTCEIAQSEHFTGQAPFSRFWIHVGMVEQDGEKMSKSLGNLTLIRDLVKTYSPDEIRVTLLNHHYRYPWECFAPDLDFSRMMVESFKKAQELAGPGEIDGQDTVLRNRFTAAMENDMNTPEALLLLHHAADHAVEKKDRAGAREVVKLAKVLGLTLQ
jgi:L-cysteine:1D-myo-inositol 2-amino-2-deoxy-alpha-D-glucopyranoside ligase